MESAPTLLWLHRRLAAARREPPNDGACPPIEATDRQIDRLVYELYDLTGQEIVIVEEATER